MEQYSFANITVVVLQLVLLLVDGESLFAGAATFTVGGSEGWTIHQARAWPNGKTFNGGDYLEFVYNYEFTNVIVVANKTEYEACRFPIRGGAAYQTGDDYIPLNRGHNYFFSEGVVGQCRQGFKMLIVAE